MDIAIKNLGPISEANFTVGYLTVICGKNNTGKTYITYATYGFLDFWKKYKPDIFSNNLVFSILSKNNLISLDFNSLNSLLYDDLIKASKIYTSYLSKIFSSNKNSSEKSSFNINANLSDNNLKKTSETIYIEDGGVITIELNNSHTNSLNANIIITYGIENRPDVDEVANYLNYAVREIVFPNVFIASAERSGAALFQREVDFSRSRIVDLLKETTVNTQQLLGQFTADYPQPVKHNIDFIRNLPNIVSRQSEFAQDHPEILNIFNEIAGGSYAVSGVGGINYSPASQADLNLTLAESSSTVRSLADIGFYLKHLAKKGELLMVDEPELNLHPENQRKIARLFAMLVNAGIRVFITTHSDYIIKEFNTLLLLNKNDERIQDLAKREGYQPSELLRPEQLNIYMTVPDEKVNDKLVYTVVPAKISAENGIELTSFDTVIEDMNRIQDEIVWG